MADVADVLLAQGNLPAALSSHRAGLGIFDRLARSDPGNTEWQRDLSLSYASLANIYRKAGQTTTSGGKSLPRAGPSFCA